MTLHANTDWAKRAFLQVKSTLTAEIGSPAGAFISEDYIRSAMLRGLMLSEPAKAARVQAEWPAPWTSLPCQHCINTPTGSPVRHDVAVPPIAGDAGLVCEVKWLKQAKGKEVMADIWKIAITRSLIAEQAATRAFLLIGGEGDALSKTLKTLKNNDLVLRWSPQGKAKGLPKPTVLDLDASFAKGAGAYSAWESLVGWGSKPRHFRTCPPVWASLNAIVRDRWLLTIGTRKWRAVLWELDHRGSSGGTDCVNYATQAAAMTAKHVVPSSSPPVAL